MGIQPRGDGSLFRKKNLDEMMAAANATGEGHLRRSIGTFSLTLLGVGCVVGTGIFFVLSATVPVAGPAVMFSFIIVAVIAGLTALCYAEVASAVPVSGSAYSYAMITLGEFPAYVIGWCLVLEYGVGGAATAVGWSEYFNEFLQDAFGWHLPDSLSNGPMGDGAQGWINLPAVILVAVCGFLLVRGVRDSARVNAVLVIVKLGVLIFFVVIAVSGFTASKFHPFAPHGFAGVAASLPPVLFTFLGLDVVSTASEEVKDPRRTIPRAIIGALLIVTLVYLAVAGAALGAQYWTVFDGQEAGLAKILTLVTNSTTPAIVLALGAVISVFSVTLANIYGQTRILFAMGRDGLLPQMFRKVNRRTLSPNGCVTVTCVIIAALAGTTPITKLWDLVSIGTIAAFIAVSAAVIVLRRSRPDLSRGFKVPFYPLTPILSIAACLWVATTVAEQTWLYVGAWLIFVVAVYFVYGRRHSVLNTATMLGARK